MLVLTRRVGETIMVDEKVRVTVLETCGAKVRLGITAPSTVRIDREEVHERRNLTPYPCPSRNGGG